MHFGAAREGAACCGLELPQRSESSRHGREREEGKMRDLFKAGGAVALSAGVFAVLYPLAGGSLGAPAASKAVGRP